MDQKVFFSDTKKVASDKQKEDDELKRRIKQLQDYQGET